MEDYRLHGLVQCKYDGRHFIKHSRIAIHYWKCHMNEVEMERRSNHLQAPPPSPTPPPPSSSSTNIDSFNLRMVQCPVDPFHIMLRHRLTAHMWKCHAQEAEAAKEADYQTKMKEWEQWEKERPAPIQPVVSCSGELPQPFENWDEDLSLPYICAAAKRRHYKK
ncbi:hypothetical protein FQR65_LT11861 [Abscondita terminalis]|nr:hypothetical protein FQR65_LT11861 [Abscondita terminalis]